LTSIRALASLLKYAVYVPISVRVDDVTVDDCA
jgi:hypothetical protein